MNVRPLHDRLLIQRLDEGEQKVGAIIIPDSAKEKPQQGKVIAAGNGKTHDDGKRVPLDVHAGDTILFGKYSGKRSISMVRTTSSCGKTTSWASSTAPTRRNRSRREDSHGQTNYLW